jgi:hypothetical protein
MALVPAKAALQDIIAVGARVLGFVQRRLWLMQAQEDQAEAIHRLTDEVATLQDQVRTMQAREDVLLAKAGQAAAHAAVATVADLARRIGHFGAGK